MLPCSLLPDARVVIVSLRPVVPFTTKHYECHVADSQPGYRPYKFVEHKTSLLRRAVQGAVPVALHIVQLLPAPAVEPDRLHHANVDDFRFNTIWLF